MAQFYGLCTYFDNINIPVKFLLKSTDFCHLLMLFQIIFVVLCPKYDNLKQGKFFINLYDKGTKRIHREKTGKMVLMRILPFISTARTEN